MADYLEMKIRVSFDIAYPDKNKPKELGQLTREVNNYITSLIGKGGLDYGYIMEQKYKQDITNFDEYSSSLIQKKRMPQTI
jgi:hypothetical protein